MRRPLRTGTVRVKTSREQFETPARIDDATCGSDVSRGVSGTDTRKGRHGTGGVHLENAMRRVITALAFIVLGTLSTSVSAQEEEEVQTRFYDFNDMLIDGEFQRPEGMFATERGQARFDSLLSLRRSFIDEIEASAEEDALE